MAKVLIIDSDMAAAQQLKEALAAQGVEAHVTGDGNDGLGLVKTYAPSCVVLCVELPRVSGYSICNKLKKDPALSAVPLILTSSQATEETFEQHKKLKTRAEGYLKKPYDLGQLLALLGQHVPLKAAAATLGREPT
ncbi:MAG TPA: response regulator, partial [Myxococcota bacterium]|nr:response regulator [Myxococcota bacterium]